MSKTVEEMTTEELLAEVRKRDEHNRKKADAARAKALREEKKKYSRIEKMFQESVKTAQPELDEARKLVQHARKLVVAAAEKTGIPLRWEDEVYFPTTIDKWECEGNFDADERMRLQRLIADSVYHQGIGEANPGAWWAPSQVC